MQTGALMLSVNRHPQEARPNKYSPRVALTNNIVVQHPPSKRKVGATLDRANSNLTARIRRMYVTAIRKGNKQRAKRLASVLRYRKAFVPAVRA